MIIVYFSTLDIKLTAWSGIKSILLLFINLVISRV